MAQFFLNFNFTVKIGKLNFWKKIIGVWFIYNFELVLGV